MRTVKRELKITRQDDGAIVFDKNRGIYLQVNAVGLIIIEGLASGKTSDELIEELMEIFSIDHAQAQSDIESFMSNLREEGLA